ncbi:DUF3566 domain-containing protein [Arthrobacter mobilis]|uniref:DUF3566 domain-containing protein n=1 Tax=Arthrobacter mobilis TaxID=2724944 RepID=A0A7X6HFK6_9MICC|nr:DUF3566 domain-containing protein [Arthrobacter mobilis]NKX55455.1 hypothetical protein [Arthrobacter mobilis]
MSTPNTPRSGTRPQPAAAPRAGVPRTAAAPAKPAQRPTAGSTSGARTGNGQRPPAAQRPAASRPSGNAGLVRPAPKAKARRARLLVSKVDPWSVLKMAFLLSVALGIVTVVASIVLWTTLDITGIFNRVNDLLSEIAGSEGAGFDLRSYMSLGQVASFATIISVVNVVLLTALSMLSAVLYNISATLVGGIGVTLTDD